MATNLNWATNLHGYEPKLSNKNIIPRMKFEKRKPVGRASFCNRIASVQSAIAPDASSSNNLAAPLFDHAEGQPGITAQ